MIKFKNKSLFLEGRDCIGCDRTGSGKTFAFALPIVQTLSKDPYGIFALILTPTRELAYQVLIFWNKSFHNELNVFLFR